MLDKQVSKSKNEIEKVREQLVKETRKKNQFKDQVENLKMKQELSVITARPTVIQPNAIKKSKSKEEVISENTQKELQKDILLENTLEIPKKEITKEITKEMLINPVFKDLDNWSLHDLETIEESIRLMKKKVKSQRKKKEDEDESKSNGLCVVCVSNRSCMVIIPCGHLSLCESCSGQLKKCPICRCDVINFIKTFVT